MIIHEKFMIAIKNNNLEEVKSLLKNVDIDTSYNYNSPLILASRSSFIDISKLIISHNTFNPLLGDYSLLRNLLEEERSEILYILLKEHDISTFNNIVFIDSCYNGYTKIVKLLLQDKKIDPTTSDNLAIIESCQNGHIDIIHLLLKNKNVNPAANKNLALIMAAQNGHFNVIEILLKDRRVNPSVDNNYPINIAYELEHYKVVNLLWRNEIVKNNLKIDNFELFEILITPDLKNKIMEF
jgi:ankyrin repeat protein